MRKQTYLEPLVEVANIGLESGIAISGETVIMDGVSVAAGPEGKIPSGSSMTVTFKAAPKLADRIKKTCKLYGRIEVEEPVEEE